MGKHKQSLESADLVDPVVKNTGQAAEVWNASLHESNVDGLR